MPIAHRGGAALAPENTLAAFAMAASLGFRYLETDVRVTSDGHLVCFHDRRLDRVTTASGPVRSKSLQELRPLRINGTEPIPTFDEALDAFPDQCFTVDIKDRAGVAPLVKSLQRKGVAERVCIAGVWDGWLAHIRREVPDISTALGWRSLGGLLSCARAGLRPPKALATAPFAHVPVKLGCVPIFVERLVAMSHDIGVRIVAWTVDEPEVIRRLLDAGVDAIITDRPDILRDVFVQSVAWQPRLPATLDAAHRAFAPFRPVPPLLNALETGLN